MGDSSKEKIIKAATQVFAEKGFEGASIREIASLAGVNLASINYHFESKHNLINFLVDDFIESKLFYPLQTLEPPESADEFKVRMRLFIKQFLTVVREEYTSFSMMQKNLDFFISSSPEVFKNSFAKIHGQIFNFVDAALKRKFSLRISIQKWLRKFCLAVFSILLKPTMFMSVPGLYSSAMKILSSHI